MDQKSCPTQKLFGVYHSAEEAGRAIRQLYKMGYWPEDIVIYSKDREALAAIEEGFSENLDCNPIEAGSPISQEGYEKGDLIIYTQADPVQRAKDFKAEQAAGQETAADVHAKALGDKTIEE